MTKRRENHRTSKWEQQGLKRLEEERRARGERIAPGSPSADAEAYERWQDEHALDQVAKEVHTDG